MIYTFSQSGNHSAVVTQNRSRKMREILNVALDLACAGGFDNLTLHRLAESMNRSVAAVYRYFPSREAVISELQRLIATHINLITIDAQQRVEAWAAATSADAQETAIAKILMAGIIYDEYAHQQPNELGLVMRYFSTPHHVLPEQDAAHVFEATATGLDRLAEILDTATQNGALKPGVSRDRAMMFWAALQGTINVLKIVNRGGWSPAPNLVQQALFTCLVGWGANPDVVERLTSIVADGEFTRIERSARDLLSNIDDDK